MLQEILRNKVGAIRDASGDDLLAALGLERRRPALELAGSAAAVFVVGLACGAGIALLMSPKSGPALRRDIKHKASQMADRIAEKADETVQEVRQVFTSEDNVHKQRLHAAPKRNESEQRKV